MHSMATSLNPDKGLHQLVEACALELGNTELSVAERGLAAQRLRPLISIILLPNAPAEGEDWRECLQTIVGKITQAILSLLEIRASYCLADVQAKLSIAHDLMGALDELASSDTIAIADKAPLIEAAEIIIEPALRTAVRLTDPDRVECVCDVEIGLGFSAMSIALRASAIFTNKSREMREASITIH